MQTRKHAGEPGQSRDASPRSGAATAFPAPNPGGEAVLRSEGDLALRTDLVGQLARALAPTGLNVWGVVPCAQYDAAVGVERRTKSLFPSAQCIVVVASGGPTLWRSFVAAAAADTKLLTGEPHPLDAFVRKRIMAADLTLPMARRWFFAAAEEPVQLDFRVLGALAGLGARSRLGLLLHPVYGPWIGLRAACFVATSLVPTAATSVDPCKTCPAPCVAACPGAAFPEGAWSVDRCAAFHVESDRCADSCLSREACPAGASHAYDPEERAYHANRVTGRVRLRRLLGVSDAEDPFEGQGPHWSMWRSLVDVTGAGRRRAP